MKEVLSTARNITLAVEGDFIQPLVEAVITVTEPHFRSDGSGTIERFRVPETLRFATTPDGMRLVAEKLNSYADEADEVAEKAAAGELKLLEKDPNETHLKAKSQT